ncbi:MAG TPA: OmpA family protein [Acetobacteraceae bacterium]|jgi:OOP family OmpA-OmpF porin|nr:OmpA family protein [Acetobacteraceae bacterium]
MRHYAILAATALVAAGSLVPAISWGQANPNSAQILKSLTPTGASGATRGIRVGPSAGGAGSGGGASTQSHATEAAPAVSLTVQFATGSADLTPAARQVLDNLGKAITDKSLANDRFRIEGHTDTVGTKDVNQVLSEHRAEAVVDYLATNFHVDRGRLQPVGMGESGLLIQTPAQTNEPRNRRVQVVNIGS